MVNNGKNNANNTNNINNTTSVLKIIENLRATSRAHKNKIERAMRKMKVVLGDLREQEREFSSRIEKIIGDMEVKFEGALAEEGARATKIRGAPVFAADGKLSREARAAVNFIAKLFEESCEEECCNIEAEGLSEVHDLIQLGALTKDRDALDRIDASFDTLRAILVDVASTWISERFGDDVLEIIQGAIDEKRVVLLHEVVLDQLPFFEEGMTIDSILKLDTEGKVELFEAFLENAEEKNSGA